MSAAESNRVSDRKAAIGLIVVFFLSGMCGLIYEVAWMRRLGLSLGTSHLAIVIVLAVFMTGLAVGYSWGSARSRSLKNCFTFYALLEILIGVYGCSSPFLLDVADNLNLVLSNFLNTTNSFFLTSFAGPFLLSFCFLIIPTVSMGATLPIIIQGTSTAATRIGKPVALFYGINTAGAVIGTLAGGLALIPLVGVTRTLVIAGVINILIGCSILFLYRSHDSRPHSVSEPSSPDTSTRGCDNENELRGKAETVLLFGYSLAGLASLACQVTWTRGMILSFGSSIYAFTLVLATFLGGIALGSLLFPVLFSRRKVNLVQCASLHIGISIGITFSIMLIGVLPVLFLFLFKLAGGSLLFLFAGEFFLAIATIIFPTLLMGLLFPFLCEFLVKTRTETGKIAGRLGAFNTYGSVAGIFLSGLVLIPWLGSEMTLRLAAFIYLGLGLVFIFLSRRFGKARTGNRSVFSLAGIAFLLLLVVPNWDPVMLTQGIFQYAPQVKGFKLPLLDVLYYRDGWTSQVAVTEQMGIRSLRINGKVDGSDERDMRTQIMLAALPAVLAPARDNVFILGLGTGVTAGTVLEFEPRSVICCEIEERVLEAAHLFSHVNGNIFDDTRMQIIIDDARFFLRKYEGQFDIMINEPSNPWIRGIANLFTIEFFELCRQKLSENGIICQWLHLYGMSESDTRIALNSFLHVFPQVSIWEGSKGDILLIGSQKPIQNEFDHVEREFSDHLSVFRRADLPDFNRFLQSCIVHGESIRSWAAEAALNKDDCPIIEFTTPLNLYRDISSPIVSKLFQMGFADLPPLPLGDQNVIRIDSLLFLRAMKLLDMGHQQESLQLLQQGYRLNPDNNVVLFNLAMMFVTKGELLHAESLITGNDRLPHDPLLLFGYAQILQKRGLTTEAIKACNKAIELEPSFVQARNLLESLYYQAESASSTHGQGSTH